ncbi:MAG: MGMT family protein [Verrucomicrobiaceae bacterium]|nr:MAG: MGMT family protein [Verrucomicrobiaceae bacterium]
MRAQTLSAGGIDVRLLFQGERLHSVQLPELPPASFDAVALLSVLGELERHILDMDNASPFCRLAWESMRRIPAGSAATYSEIAESMGNPRAVRAVGHACATNRLLLVVPCHRILASNGLGGFRLGLPWKQRLLELESEFADLR